MMKWLKRLFWLMLLMFALGVAAVAAFYFHLEKDLPDVSSLKEASLETPMRVYSRDGKLIAEFGEIRRIPLQYDEIPEQLRNAFLAIEDARFYEHPGIDLIGITRAFVVWMTTGQMKQGASTITQQVARNFFLSREKTLLRKVKEVFLAWRIEQELSKNEILALYLNKIPLGYRSYGIGAAAQVYYGKEVKDLTLGQMAVLAGLPKAPSMLNPIRSPQRALARRNLVLQRMLQLGMIDRAQHDAAAAEPIKTHYHGAEVQLDAPYLAEMVRSQMVEQYGDQAYIQGLNIYTTVTAVRQEAANAALFKGLMDYDERHGYRGPEKSLWAKGASPWSAEQIFAHLDEVASIDPFEPGVVIKVSDRSVDVLLKGGLEARINWDGLSWARPFISDSRQGVAPRKAADILKTGDQIWVWPQSESKLRLVQIPDANAALIALDPIDGAIEAISGGFSFQVSKFNRALQARRQVGSNIKPFLYSTALDHGFTLASIINDAPINQWDAGSGKAWQPKNSPPIYDGPISLREALAKSKNVVSVRLLRSIGIDTFHERLQALGFPASSLQRNESISLGSVEFTPMELVAGYAVLANGGFKVAPYFIDRIEDAQGKRLFEASPKTACRGCGQLAELGLNSAQVYLDQPANWQANCAIDPTITPAPQIISEANSALISEALHSAIYGGSDRGLGGWLGTGWRAAKALQRPDLAGKTGTTNESKDAWFSGFAPEVVATAWIGFDDHRRKLGRTAQGGEFGASAAQPIWIDFMKQALQGVPVRLPTKPDEVITVRIDKATGYLSQRQDASSRDEFFQKGTEPKQLAPQEGVLFGHGDSQEAPPGETSAEDIF